MRPRARTLFSVFPKNRRSSRFADEATKGTRSQPSKWQVRITRVWGKGGMSEMEC